MTEWDYMVAVSEMIGFDNFRRNIEHFIYCYNNNMKPKMAINKLING